MGRSFRLHAASFFTCATLAAVLASGCGSKREVLATDHEDPVHEPDFGSTEAGAAPVGPDASTVGLCPSNVCPEGRTTCPNNPFPCAVDLLSDDDNCGACGRHCPRSNSYMTEFGAYTKCIEGACRRVCLSYKADCNGLPEDGCETNIDVDKNNCGGCGVKCADICINGVCGCTGVETFCTASGECKNLNNDDANCGACGNVCPSVAQPPFSWGAQRACASGKCNQLVCNNLRFDCNGDLDQPDGNGCEINGANDPNNCGGCGKQCGPGQTCYGGQCLCPSGTVLCGTSKCVDVGSDIDSCGVCSYQCPGDRRSLFVLGAASEPDPAHGRPTCEQGVCGYRCSPSFGDCDGNIGNGCETSLLDDPLNCGGCGIRCNGVENQACVNGQCTMKPCEVR